MQGYPVASGSVTKNKHVSLPYHETTRFTGECVGSTCPVTPHVESIPVMSGQIPLAKKKKSEHFITAVSGKYVEHYSSYPALQHALLFYCGLYGTTIAHSHAMHDFHAKAKQNNQHMHIVCIAG